METKAILLNFIWSLQVAVCENNQNYSKGIKLDYRAEVTKCGLWTLEAP